jgi:hypothetical protein
MKNLKTNLLTLVIVALGWTIASAAIQDKPAPTSDEAMIAQQLPSYPLDACPVSGKKLDSSAIDVMVDGTLVRLCCERCKAKVDSNASVFKSKVEEAVITQQMMFYPTDKCLISGEPLDAQGEPVSVVSGTRLVRFCCNGCAKKFRKNPSEHLASLDIMLIKSQRETYPLKNCLISEEPLGSMGEPIDILHGVTLVRLCCKGCGKSFEKDPMTHVAAVHAAYMAEGKGKQQLKVDAKKAHSKEKQDKASGKQKEKGGK